MCLWAFFLPLHPEQVQWLFDFYVFGVQEVSQTLMSNFLLSYFTSVPPVWLYRGTLEIPNTVKRRSHDDSQSKIALFRAVWHASFMHPRFMLQFYLHGMWDGIFGEGLCFLQLNHQWNNVHFHLYQTCMQTCIWFWIIAASRHRESYWCRSYRKGIFKSVLLVRAVIRSQSSYKEGAHYIKRWPLLQKRLM